MLSALMILIWKLRVVKEDGEKDWWLIIDGPCDIAWYVIASVTISTSIEFISFGSRWRFPPIICIFYNSHAQSLLLDKRGIVFNIESAMVQNFSKRHDQTLPIVSQYRLNSRELLVRVRGCE